MANRASPLNYAYAIGRIKALERFLLKQEAFEEALEADLQGALQLFAESDLYADEILKIRDSQQLEAALEKELAKLKTLIRQLLLDKGLVSLLEFEDLHRMETVCRQIKSSFLLDYVMHLTDMHNIKTFLRLYALKEPKEKLNQFLSNEGFIQKNVFLNLYEQDLSAFLNKMEYINKKGEIINYAFFLEEAIEKIKNENSFVFLEKAIYNFLSWALTPARYLNFGPEPVISYYFAKRNEIALMRTVILSKLNNLPKEFIEKGLAAAYA